LGAVDLGQDDVHLWYVLSDEVRDSRTLERYAALMTPEEHARHDRFVFAKDRHQFLVTRGVIRTLVARYLAIDPSTCEFEADRYGRPSLSRPSGAGLAFNISHTTGLVACALAREPEIGVDTEDASRPIDRELARRFFSPAEADALDALPEPARATRFFEYWTLKEAYIKARGMGMSLPLDGFSMTIGAGHAPSILFAPTIDDDPGSWQFAQFRPTPRHHLAVAVRRRGPDRAIELRELRVE
jgi:4'-phosphopantetheinyl transferase